MISHEAVKKILGISENVDMDVLDMANKITITFLPYTSLASSRVIKLSDELKNTFVSLGVKIVPFDTVWEKISINRRIKRLVKYETNNLLYAIRSIFKLPQKSFYISFAALKKLCSKYRIKKNITIVCVGEQDVINLPMQYISSFKSNSIITILDLPNSINDETDFMEHFNHSMSLFAYHMTNIIIGVNDDYWLMYNFNASHPIYKYPDPDFNNHILKSLIPKLAAPISPHKLSDFIVHADNFETSDESLNHAISDMKNGAIEFSKTNLFPSGKAIDSLPFRENIHKLIGKLHLDNRSGMSFGYLAYQLPPEELSVPENLDNFLLNHPNAFENVDYYIDNKENIFLKYLINGEYIVLKIPEVWVLSLRSGANKTNFNVNTDLIKMGLSKGKLMIQWPRNISTDNTYKPSFDTKVILAHALGNLLVASVAKYTKVLNSYVKRIETKGFAICHWHGYFNKENIMENVISYGYENSHVSCSSPQSAIYALEGKLSNILDRVSYMRNYDGDIHVEPHHGINVSYSSLVDLAKYILNNPNSTKLGNKFL